MKWINIKISKCSYWKTKVYDHDLYGKSDEYVSYHIYMYQKVQLTL